MKLSLSSSELLAQLQTASRVASTRSAVQALSGVMIRAEENGCELLATDMEVGLRVPLAAEVSRTGAAVLPARLLLDVARSLPTETLTMELRVAEQTVFHLHLHLVPRWHRDGFGRIWPVEGRYEDADLEDVANRIREACRGSQPPK